MADAKIRHQLRLLEFEVSRTVSRPETFEPITFESAVTRSDIIEQILFWAFVVGLAWVPFWYGSNQPVAWGINAVLFPGLAVLYEISLLLRGGSHPVALGKIRVPAALFIAVVVWILIQNATWTPTFLHQSIWNMAGTALPTPIEGSISVNRDLTTLALLRLLTAASVLWLAMQLCRSASRAFQFLWAFLAVSVGYALYGIVAFAATQLSTPTSRGFMTSAFYNHNHYATYAGMGLIAALGLIARVYERTIVTDDVPLRFKVGNFIDVTGRATLPLAAAFLLLVALMLTQSRGGIMATALGIVVWGALTFRRTQSSLNERRLIIILGTAVIAGIFIVFGDAFFSKVAQAGLADPNRADVYTITLRSILDAPLAGYGYGTFGDVFPMFRDRSIDVYGVWLQAHNSYLEVLQGLGLIFGSMLVACLAILVMKCGRGAMLRQQITIPCIATGIAFLVGIHAMVDFSLQIQAVTLTFVAILGAGVAQSTSSQLAMSD